MGIDEAEIARSLSSDNITELTAIIEKLGLLIDQTLTEPAELSGRHITVIKQYIQDHYDKLDFSLQALARHFGTSPSNISHYFKKQTSITLKDYLASIKLGRAKELLTETDDTIDEIARKLGYSNTAGLIRLFKQQVGATPGEYRKSHK